MNKPPCESCGTIDAPIRKRRYSDGKSHFYCWSCRTKKSKELKKKQAAAYRGRKKTIKNRGAVCQICGKKTNNLHQHHINRVTDGGSNEDENLLLLCVECHKKQHHGYLK